MATELSILSSLSQTASLLGLFQQQVNNAYYTNPNGKKVSFIVLDTLSIPLEQYASGVINSFNLVSSTLGLSDNSDPNTGLFNTFLAGTTIQENIQRKYAINRVPFANYDQIVDIGLGSQTLRFVVVIAGTMYQTAWRNLVQNLFDNQTSGLGTLYHPFYQTINNVLPVSVGNAYESTKLNCVMLEIFFLTSDISHLNPDTINTSIVAEIAIYYQAVAQAVLNIQSLSKTFGGEVNNITAGL